VKDQPDQPLRDVLIGGCTVVVILALAALSVIGLEPVFAMFNDGFWQSFERLTWVMAAFGVIVAVWQLRLVLQEQQRIRKELSRRPAFHLEFSRAAALPTWVTGTEPPGVIGRITNTGSRSGRSLRWTVLLPAELKPVGIGGDPSLAQGEMRLDGDQLRITHSLDQLNPGEHYEHYFPCRPVADRFWPEELSFDLTMEDADGVQIRSRVKQKVVT
jgi:hypothetical protein